MKMRLTDQMTADEQFTASSISEFRARSAVADFLHVATDRGEWISPYYPHSNDPLLFSAWRTTDAAISTAYNLCLTANLAGTRFDYEIATITGLLTE